MWMWICALLQLQKNCAVNKLTNAKINSIAQTQLLYKVRNTDKRIKPSLPRLTFSSLFQKPCLIPVPTSKSCTSSNSWRKCFARKVAKYPTPVMFLLILGNVHALGFFRVISRWAVGVVKCSLRALLRIALSLRCNAGGRRERFKVGNSPGHASWRGQAERLLWKAIGYKNLNLYPAHWFYAFPPHVCGHFSPCFLGAVQFVQVGTQNTQKKLNLLNALKF